MCVASGLVCSPPPGKLTESPGFFRDAFISVSSLARVRAQLVSFAKRRLLETSHQSACLRVSACLCSSQTKVSRVIELEADLYGLHFAALAGYNPKTALGFFNMSESKDAARRDFGTALKTHPDDDVRYGALVAWIDGEQLRSLVRRKPSDAGQGLAPGPTVSRALGLHQLVEGTEGEFLDDHLQWLVILFLGIMVATCAFASLPLAQLWENVHGRMLVLRFVPSAAQQQAAAQHALLDEVVPKRRTPAWLRPLARPAQRGAKAALSVFIYTPMVIALIIVPLGDKLCDFWGGKITFIELVRQNLHLNRRRDGPPNASPLPCHRRHGFARQIRILLVVLFMGNDLAAAALSSYMTVLANALEDVRTIMAAAAIEPAPPPPPLAPAREQRRQTSSGRSPSPPPRATTSARCVRRR